MTMGSALGAAVSMGALLASCAVATPLAITSTGPGIARGSSVAMTMPEQSQSERGRFSNALGKAMMARNVEVSEVEPDKKAELLADFSVSITDASSGVLNGKGQYAEGEAEQDWITPPRRDRRFDKCEAKRLRATLVLFDANTGKMVYRGSGEATDCEFDDADLAALADRLVEDALTRSGR
ncbi:MAG: hypothetical protein WBA51_01785 [Erythrobacter sp.]